MGIISRIAGKARRMLAGDAQQKTEQAKAAQALALAGRVKAAKERNARAAYVEAPEVALVLQFFNKGQNIDMLWKGLHGLGPAHEIIVLEDGSVDGSLERWAELLTGRNHFIIRSNDLYEVRTYQRALQFSNAEFVVLLQDDDQMPESAQWLTDALALMREYPRLLVLGGRGGADILPRGTLAEGEPATYQVTDGVARCADVLKYNVYREPAYQAAQSGIPFQFCSFVSRAPMVVRRAELLALGGINQAYAPYSNDDTDMCLRAWQQGYQCGIYSAPFLRDVGVGGMRTFNQQGFSEQATQSFHRIYEHFDADIKSGYFGLVVAEANAHLVKR